MLQVILRIIGLVLLMCGVVMVYDARILTKTWFGFGDQNEATTGFKILGFIICIVGVLVIYFNK